VSVSLLRELRWKKLVQVAPLRWANMAPWRAARVAVGVLLPLALGYASGHIEYGAYVALGALPAGFASFQGETRSRVAAVPTAPWPIDSQINNFKN
jgi:hypothetical protein